MKLFYQFSECGKYNVEGGPIIYDNLIALVIKPADFLAS
jgi:hypothetical protein